MYSFESRCCVNPCGELIEAYPVSIGGNVGKHSLFRVLRNCYDVTVY
jgi:hypothetical protein